MLHFWTSFEISDIYYNLVLIEFDPTLQMATKFMQPPAMYHHNSQFQDSAYPGPSFQQSTDTNGRSFAFRKRFEKIDWRRIASIDIETVARTLDFNALQDNIMNITFCNIEAELVSVFIKIIVLFKQCFKRDML